MPRCPQQNTGTRSVADKAEGCEAYMNKPLMPAAVPLTRVWHGSRMVPQFVLIKKWVFGII